MVLLPDSVLVRARIVELVERLPEGFWFELAAVSDWLRTRHPTSCRERLDRALDWGAGGAYLG